VISPFNFRKINFGIKLYFFYFSVLFGWEERGESPNSGVERKGCRWQWFWPLKLLIFIPNGFILWKEFKLGVSLEVSITTDWSLGKVLVLCWFWVLRWVFAFLKVMDWFNMVPIVFSRCFGKKIGWKWVFERKKQEPYFSGNHSGHNLGGWRHIVYFFQNKLGRTTH